MSVGSRRTRAGGLALAIAVHMALLVLLVIGLAPTSLPTRMQAPLTVTFLPLPPPPPVPQPVRPPIRRIALHVRQPVGGRASAPTAPSPPPLDRLRADVPSPLATAEPITVAAAGTLPDAVATITTGDDGRGMGRGVGAGGTGNGTGSGAGSAALPPLRHAIWLHRPSDSEIRPYWPAAATRDRRSGDVLLACDVPEPGMPRRCLVVRERPLNLGFGDAAVRLSHLFRIKPVMRGDVVSSGWVLVPIVFDVSKR